MLCSFRFAPLLVLAAFSFHCASVKSSDAPDASALQVDARADVIDASVVDADTTDADTTDAVPLAVSPMVFSFTGAIESWEVPVGVTSITIEASGAAGGDGYNADGAPDDTVKGLAGEGGVVTATLTVTPGETIFISVGGKGANALTLAPGLGGFNGGGDGADSQYNPDYYGAGGGGASDVRIGGQTLADRVVVAGGGGGGSGWCTSGAGTGGNGGDLVGADGGDCVGTVGTGGTQLAGGTSNGATGVGGATGLVASQAGSGGGGGYFGGGASDGSGAGGGSSYADPAATAVTHIQGTVVGDGAITISW